MAEVIANYIGQRDGKYAVNVKPTTVPAGNLGGGGVVKSFDTAEDAKAFADAVNKNQNLTPPDKDAFVKSE
jgi:hypothetical protein